MVFIRFSKESLIAKKKKKKKSQTTACGHLRRMVHSAQFNRIMRKKIRVPEQGQVNEILSYKEL